MITGCWCFTKFGLRKIFSHGWKIEKLTTDTSAQKSLAVLLQRFAYQLV
jgi:hypothetical protein